MAMTILNNTSAALTLGELNKNVSSLGKQLKKVATGTKITDAGDDTSGYAISERMQARIRSLNQDESNTKTGMSMLKVASGGIESIIEELRSLKELAINAANDSNTAIDRATIQKEFDQRRENIDNIAVETNYNGKILLTGDYGNKSVEITTTTVIPAAPVDPPSWLSPTNPGAVGPTGAVVHSGAVEPTGTPVQITTGTYTITSSGVYELTNDAHNITIDSGVHDVKFVQAAGATLSDIHIVGPLGRANLWIEDLTVTNSNPSFITFRGSDNTLNFKGTNTIETTSNGVHEAIIYVGGGLTVEGGVDGTGVITFKDDGSVYGACIGTYYDNYTSTASVTVNSGTYAYIGAFRAGAMIGAGGYGSIGDVTINGGTFIDESSGENTIGGGAGDNFGHCRCGNIKVRNAVITANNPDRYWHTAVGTGSSNIGGDIYISNSRIETINNRGAGIGTSYNSTCGNITLENTELIVSSETGAGIGSGEKGHVGNITINNCDLTQVRSEQGEYVGRGVDGTAGTVTVNGVVVPPNDPTNRHGGGTSDRIVKSTETKIVGKPLIVHDGTKANEEIHFYINDMRTSALKGMITDASGAFVDPEDLDRLRNLSNDPAAYKAYEDILREADGKTLDDVSVNTQHGASVAMRVIDGAIQYALDEATTVGAYISRLEYTAANIVIANENTVSSESTIRDADMAKEMTEYTKSNVLTQAAQSMLAQANQNSSNVLSLLQ